LWDEITDVKSTDSVPETKLKIEGFFQKSQLDLIKPYFDKYYSVVKDLVGKKDRNWSEVFIAGLSPAFMGREEDEKAFQKLHDEQNDFSHFFPIFLKKQVEAIGWKKECKKLIEEFDIDKDETDSEQAKKDAEQVGKNNKNARNRCYSDEE